MKRIILFVICVFVCFVVENAQSQCRPFAAANKPSLGDFIHDGAYTAIQLKTGQTVQMNKTFYRGQKYRLLVCAATELAKVDFKVQDANQNVLYTGNEEGIAKKWDFSVESTQNLLISVTVPETTANQNKAGCVTILIGFKSSETLYKEIYHPK